VLSAALMLLAACRSAPHSPRKESLARLPEKFLAGSVTVSDDLRHHVYLVEERRGTRVVRDGVPGEKYGAATNRSFFPKSARSLYWARRPEGQTLVVVDDIPYPVGYARHEWVAFDPSGAHWAVLASAPDDAGAVILADGKEIGPFDDASVPAWSPAGTLTYLRAQGDAGSHERRVELMVGDTVLRDSPARKGFCQPAIGEGWRGPALPQNTALRYLSDGRLVTLMPQEDRWALTRDAEILGTFDASVPTAPGSVGPYAIAGDGTCAAGSVIAATTVTAAEQAPVTAWWERQAGADGKWRVVVDGKPAADVACLRPWPHQPPQLAADGRSVAFPCVTRFDDHGEAIMVVHGEERYGPYPEVWALALSDDGRRLAYGAADGSLDQSWAVYADGQQISPRYYAIWRPRFDPSARHLGWEAMLTAKGPNVLLLDGRRLGTFDDLVNGPLFDRPGEVGWVIRRKNRLARLNFPLPNQ
jgi:hypothetical protein